MTYSKCFLYFSKFSCIGGSRLLYVLNKVRARCADICSVNTRWPEREPFSAPIRNMFEKQSLALNCV